MLHAQSGISSDSGTTPGARLPYGDEPDPISHLLALRRTTNTITPGSAIFDAG
jgi:hypothetical protein